MENSKLFKLFRLIFVLSGLWDVSGWKTRTQYLYKMYSHIILGTLINMEICTFCLLIRISKEEAEDFNSFFVYLSALISIFLTIIKFILCKRKRFLTYLKGVFHNESILHCTTEREFKIKNDVMNRTMLFVVLFYFIGLGCILMTVAINTLLFFTGYSECMRDINDCEKKLLLKTSVPFDVPKQYLLAYVYQLSILFPVSSSLIATDVVILAPTIYFISELKNLQTMLKQICSRATIEMLRNKHFEGRSMREIPNCIIRHQQLLHEFEELQQLTASLFFFDFLIRSSQIAAITYFLLNRDAFDFFSILWIFVFTYFFSQLFLTYFFAHMLTEENYNLSNAIYETNWYILDTKSKKLLIVMMMRSQKKLALKVGLFADVDLLVFFKIVKTVYTFITIFRSRI